MSQTITSPLTRITVNLSIFSRILNKISALYTIIHESSVEAKAQYKKYSVLGGGWE